MTLRHLQLKYMKNQLEVSHQRPKQNAPCILQNSRYATTLLRCMITNIKHLKTSSFIAENKTYYQALSILLSRVFATRRHQSANINFFHLLLIGIHQYAST